MERASHPASRWLVPAVAAGLVLLLDVLRVWLPSVIFIYGRAGSTPATQMGAFAAIWVLLGVVGAVFVLRVGARRVALAAGVALAVARLVLQLSGGGDLQLYAASIGWLAAILWVAALVAGAPSRRAVTEGVALGLVVDAALRGALHTVEVTWSHGPTAFVGALALVATFVVALRRALADPAWTDPTSADGPAWPWLALGPVVILYGIVAGVPARVTIALELAPGLAAAVVTAALGLGLAWARAGSSLPARPSAVAAGLLVTAGTVLAIVTSGTVAVTGQLGLAVGTGGILGLLPRVRGTAGHRSRSVVTASSLLLLFLVGFLYYAAYDLSVGVPNGVFLVVAAAFVGLLVLAAGWRAQPPRPGVPTPSVAVAVVLTLVAGLGAASGSATAPDPGAGYPVRVALYNVHMGYDTVGRFDVGALAEVLRAESADVVVLNEADRGWFLNGSHDVLQLLAEELDLPYVFGPAADPVWGNAILSRYPLRDVDVVALPLGGAPMARSLVSAVATLPDGQELAIVGTHLHHVDGDDDLRRVQASAVAEHAALLAADGRPVVVLGDMNATPGATALAGYEEAGFVDAVAPLGQPLTFPSWDPVRRIDHIFLTPDLVASELAVPRSEASDHLAVVVTLTPSG